MNFLRRWFSKDFPTPPTEYLTLDGLFKYWNKTLSNKWREECDMVVYRLDPALAPFQSIMKFTHHREPRISELCGGAATPRNEVELRQLIHPMYPALEWWETKPDMKIKSYFLVRIIRRWTVQGAERRQEVCVAPFTSREARRQTYSTRSSDPSSRSTSPTGPEPAGKS